LSGWSAFQVGSAPASYCAANSALGGIGVVHLEVQQQPTRHLAARGRRNGFVPPVEHGKVDRRVVLQLQMHVPVAGEQRLEAEVLLVEAGGCGDVVGHDHGVVARHFHGVGPFR
jgi:hypothetical protein